MKTLEIFSTINWPLAATIAATTAIGVWHWFSPPQVDDVERDDIF